MAERPIETVMVVGSGVMGRGIAAVFAGGGHRTIVYRHTPKAGVKLAPGVTLTTELPKEAPDLIVESVYEQIELKNQVFAMLEEAYGRRPILASNTSGLPLEEMAARLRWPERFLGLHYFMPADVSPLVEVVRAAKTADAAIERVVAALRRCEREALLVSKPVVGYLWNRLQHAILHEAYYLIENRIVTPEDIDKVAKQLLGPRFCVTGLVESKDIGGLAIHVDAHSAIVPHLSHRPQASGIVRKLVDAGRLGILAGRGFFDWTGKDAETISETAKRKLRRLNAFLKDEMGRGEPDTAPGPSIPIA